MRIFFKCCLIGFCGSLFHIPFFLLQWNIYATSFPISFVIYFTISYLAFRRYGPLVSAKYIGGGLIVGLCISAFEPIIISILNSSLQIGFIPSILFRSVAVLCGFAFWRYSGATRIVPLVGGSALSLYMFLYGADIWNHYTGYGTFTGKIEARQLQHDIAGTDQYGSHFSYTSFEGKVLLVDFWMTQCGVCFQKFPKLEDYYSRRKGDSRIEIVAVNKPLEEDRPSQANDMIRERGFTFPTLMPDDPDLPEKFGVKGYPTTFVIDLNGNIIYRGSLEGAISLAESLIAAK